MRRLHLADAAWLARWSCVQRGPCATHLSFCRRWPLVDRARLADTRTTPRRLQQATALLRSCQDTCSCSGGLRHYRHILPECAGSAMPKWSGSCGGAMYREVHAPHSSSLATVGRLLTGRGRPTRAPCLGECAAGAKALRRGGVSWQRKRVSPSQHSKLLMRAHVFALRQPHRRAYKQWTRIVGHNLWHVRVRLLVCREAMCSRHWKKCVSHTCFPCLVVHLVAVLLGPVLLTRSCVGSGIWRKRPSPEDKPRTLAHARRC